MPLDAGIIERSIGELNPVNQLQKMQALKTMQLQQQDIGSQIQERNAIAAQRQAEVQQGTAAAQTMQDHFASQVAAGKPIDFDDPALMQKLYATAPKFADTYSTTRAKVNADKATAANQAGDLTVKQNAEKNAEAKSVWEQQQAKIKSDREAAADTQKQAEEAAGTLITGSEFTTPDANGKPSRAAKFRVRQPDGTYQNETRILGQEAAPPKAPVPGVDVPFPAAVATQKGQIAAAGRAPVQPATATIDDPNNPGHQMLVAVDRSGGTASPVTIAGQTATKTPPAQLNKTTADNKAYDDAQKSLTALEGLAKQNTYPADQAMADQYFNIIKPGSGARMNEANIKRLLTPGPLMDKVTAWAQKLDQGQPLDPAARQAILEAARIVAESKKPAATAASGQVAPEGTVITLANGQKQVKRGGKWVNQ